MNIEHADLAGIPRQQLKFLVLGLAQTVTQHPDALSPVWARFGVALAERIDEFDAGETDLKFQLAYHGAVCRLAETIVPGLAEAAQSAEPGS